MTRGLLLALVAGCGARSGLLDGDVPGPPEPSPCVAKVEGEVCNGLDDDCDGEIDEGLGFGPLGDTLVLRTDEFDTGGCGSCSWAWGTALAPAGDDLLALWNLGLYGGAEQPTLYGRKVDVWGAPLEEVRRLRDDFLLEIQPMQALLPLPPRGLPFDASFRVAHDDHSGFLFVAADGTLDTVMPTPATSPWGIPRTVWTGERFVSAWGGETLHVASLSPDGDVEASFEVDELGYSASVNIAVYPGRVGVLVARYEDDPQTWDQWFLLLDARGEVVVPAHLIDIEYQVWQRLAATEEGWLVMQPRLPGEPTIRQTLDVDGEPTSAPAPFEDARQLSETGSQDTFVLRPLTHELVGAFQDMATGEVQVERLDGEGRVREAWSGPLDGSDLFVDPNVAFVGDHLLVAWHGLAGDAAPNAVYVRAFGCVP